MEKYIKPLQEYLDDNYSDTFDVLLEDYDLVIFHKTTKKAIIIIGTFEYGDEFEIYTFENCRFKFIDGVIRCLEEFDEGK